MFIILNHIISLLAIQPGDSTPLDMKLTKFHVNNILRICIPLIRLNVILILLFPIGLPISKRFLVKMS